MLRTIELHHYNAENMRREFRAVALRAVGFTDDEIKRLEIAKLNPEQFQELVKNKLSLNLSEPGPNRHLILPLEEAEKWVNEERWKPLSYANGKVLIESPTSDPKPSAERPAHPVLADSGGSQPQFARGHSWKDTSPPMP